MTVQLISAAQAIERLTDFDAVIDARSESEYALDRLPTAVNWPTLNDDERKEVGTLYVQSSPFVARKRGAALAAANIARHIDHHVADKPKPWQPLVYCWRGGKRSGSLALVLDQIGFRVHVIEGGYKAFRGALIADLPVLAQQLQYRVIAGPTGSGKTRLLRALAAVGAQVLDLEGLANHRSSVLGFIPGLPQPSQKRFETLVWTALRSFDPARPVFVESESKKVGNLSVPDLLMSRIRQSPCLNLQLCDDERVALLLEDYDFFVTNPALFSERLDALIELRGKTVVQGWKDQIERGEIELVVRELLHSHYDPGYLQSIARNFPHFPAAVDLVARDRSSATMTELAQQILKAEP